MTKNFRDKIALSGITVLSIGLILLIITFASAFGFLSESLPILTSEDLVQTFGGTLAPLIAASIRVMYLGVMGWIGSLVTIRGVTIMAHTPKTEKNDLQNPKEPTQEKLKVKARPAEDKVKSKQEKQHEKQPETKPEAKPGELELVVIPSEEMEQRSQKPQA